MAKMNQNQRQSIHNDIDAVIALMNGETRNKWQRETAHRAVVGMAERYGISLSDAQRLMDRVVSNFNNERIIREMQSHRNAKGYKIPSKANMPSRIHYPLIAEGQEVFGPVHYLTLGAVVYSDGTVIQRF